MSAPALSLVLIGFGHVGQRFVKLLSEVAERLDFEWRVVAIATRRHGSVIDPQGVDIARALSLIEAGLSLDVLDADPRERSGLDVIRQAARALADEAAESRVVCVESTVLDIDHGEPAVSHVRAALEAQMHVVTVNKGPAAFAYDGLESLADTMDRVFFFEGAVMDGIPVFNLVRETMPAVRIDGFRGVINTTANFILSALERGQAFDDARPRDAGARDRRGRPLARCRWLGRGGQDRRARQRADGRRDDAASSRSHRDCRGEGRRPAGRPQTGTTHPARRVGLASG